MFKGEDVQEDLLGPLGPENCDRPVVPKRRHGITTLRCVMPQVRFVVDTVTLWQVFPRVLHFSPVSLQQRLTIVYLYITRRYIILAIYGSLNKTLLCPSLSPSLCLVLLPVPFTLYEAGDVKQHKTQRKFWKSQSGIHKHSSTLQYVVQFVHIIRLFTLHTKT